MIVISELSEIPKLSASWLHPLEDEDPELYEELAADLLIGPSDKPVSPNVFGESHFHVCEVLNHLDLHGKQIGGFEMPGSPGDNAVESLKGYDAARKSDFSGDADILFVGDFGNALIVSLDNQIGVMDLSGDELKLEYLAPSFDRFIVTQANAYDAFKRHIVEGEDEDAYWSACKTCLDHPAFKGTDVERIFYMQLKG